MPIIPPAVVLTVDAVYGVPAPNGPFGASLSVHAGDAGPIRGTLALTGLTAAQAASWSVGTKVSFPVGTP